MDIVDITIHVNEDLASAQKAALENSLRELDGVVSMCCHKQTPHLLLVMYNPQKLDSQAMLGRVKADGYHAQLVGI